MLADPLNIIIVKSDSKGDRLLFRYPHELNKVKKPKNVKRKNPYALVCSDDNKPCSGLLTNISEDNHLVGFADSDLSNLFAVKGTLTGKKFELKVNDVRFVGHPNNVELTNNESVLINVVFALRALASHSIVQSYYNLCEQIVKALLGEQGRKRFIEEEFGGITQYLDDGYNHSHTLEVFEIPKILKKVYEQVRKTGIMEVTVNDYTLLNQCIPQKVQMVKWNCDNVIEPEYVELCLHRIQPYHAMLLLEPASDVANKFFLNVAPPLMRLLFLYSPLKSLMALATDADIACIHAIRVLSHLVRWGDATIIYPIAATNKYVIAPNTSRYQEEEIQREFSGLFPEENLLEFLQEFSNPTSLSQRINPLNTSSEQLHLVHLMVWCLQKHLLVQLHTYVQYIPDSFSVKSVALNKRQSKRDNSKSRSTYNGRLSDHFHHTRTESESGTSTISDDVLDQTSNAEDFGQSLDADDDIRSDFCEDILSELPEDERKTILNIPASDNVEDLTLFARLLQNGYFDGAHHLEDIMFKENLRRSSLLEILEKFRDVLVLYETEDPTIAMMSDPNYLELMRI